MKVAFLICSIVFVVSVVEPLDGWPYYVALVCGSWVMGSLASVYGKHIGSR